MSVETHVRDAVQLVLIDQRDSLFGSSRAPVPTSPRSLLKPLQVAALLRMAQPLTDEQVAIAASSHNGEPIHLERVAELAEALSVELAALPVRPHRPLIGELEIDTDFYPLMQEANPCAGKHILAAHCAQSTGIDYLEFGGPIERTCRQHVREACRIRRELAPVPDGCGFPTYAITDVELATGLRSLLLSDDQHDVQVVRSLAAHPHLVGGRGRAVTHEALTSEVLFAKDGIGGLFAVAYSDGAVAVGRATRDDQKTLASALGEARSLARSSAS
jgi:L-asparaginase II